MPHRLARAIVLLLLLTPALAARLRARPAPPEPPCVPEGRGTPPRHFIGCAADPGPPRAFTGDERLALGLPLDPNLATAAELGRVPGLSRRLGAAIVHDRVRNGPFRDVEALGRVKGIGPRRLALARPALSVGAPP